MGVNDTANQTIFLDQFTNSVVLQKILWQMVGGVNDTADHLWAVSMTLCINIDTVDHINTTCLRLLFSLKGIYKSKNHT
jgi:hypothetical protein